MPLIKGKVGAFLNLLLALLTWGKKKDWFDKKPGVPVVLLLLFMGCGPVNPCLNQCPPDRWHLEDGKCVCLPPYNPSPSPSVPPTPEATPSVPPSPSPEPSAEPSPEPTPSPTPPACNLPVMPECGGPENPPGVWGCCSEGRPSKYHAAVESVVGTVLLTHGWSPNAPLPDPDLFISLVVKGLEAAGYCAKQGGPADEVGVKLDNTWSEQFDIVRRDLYPQVLHTVSCDPARF